MGNKVYQFNLRRLRAFDIRKAKDYQALFDMCGRSSKISFNVLKENARGIPVEYEVIYNVKSIVGIKADKSPIYGNKHHLNIKLMNQYPDEPPICYFQTPVWHPNIKFSGSTKGNVCYNSPGLASNFRLDELVEFIGKILQYKNYHAILDREPYPEDVEVAKWVLNYAEPKGLVSYKQNRPVDDSYLLDPLPGYEPKPKPDIDWDW